VDDVLGYAGRCAVVTGVASGMGAATVRVLVGSVWASDVAGESLYADGGVSSALQTGQIDCSHLIPGE
jgi:hypothetical protein